MAITIVATSLNAQFHYEIPKSQTQNRTQARVQQTKQASSFDWNKVTFGGGVGLQFGDYTVVNIAPQVGYNFSKMFNAGFGFSYSYYKDRYYVNGDKWKETASYFGFNVYARFYPINNIIIMAQPDINRMWRTDEAPDGYKIKDEKFIPSFLIGGGLRLGPMSVMLKYDLVQDKDSPYGNNIFYSVGFSF
ncbi:hypothetical protein D0T56_06455 [Dysgonomonas sp. 520]|nr:hypothetical protein [Dysgonomonas sp. 520]